MRAKKYTSKIKHSLNNQTPDSWTTVPLEKVLDKIIGGGTPSKSIGRFWNGSIPWLTVKDMKDRRPKDSIDHISQEAIHGSATNIIPADTVIIATRIGLGKVIRVSYDAAINQDLKALIASNKVDKGYLEYWIISIADYLISIGSGTTVKGLRLEQLRSLPFPLAPIDQQKRLVAEIEKQFSRLDQAVVNLRRVKINLARYKAAVLKAAVEGKLTEAWRKKHPEVEPAHKLLQRILTQRRHRWEETERAKMTAKGKVPKNDKWKGKYKEPPTPQIDAAPMIPPKWIWTSIGQTFEVYIGATPSRQKSEFWGGDIPWVSSGEVAFCRIKDTREKITNSGLKKSSTNIHPVGTVLLGMIGEGKTRGQTAILDIEACNNQNAAAIRVSETAIIPEFIYSFLEKEYENTRRRGSGGNQPALNKSRVMNIIFPLPPIQEQKAIVNIIQQYLSNIESLLSIVSANLVRADRLRQSILKKAFSGQLILSNGEYDPETTSELPLAAESTVDYQSKKTVNKD